MRTAVSPDVGTGRKAFSPFLVMEPDPSSAGDFALTRWRRVSEPEPVLADTSTGTTIGFRKGLDFSTESVITYTMIAPKQLNISGTSVEGGEEPSGEVRVRARAMERRRFAVVTTADSVAAGTVAASEGPPAFGVINMRLNDARGLEVVAALRKARPGAPIVMLIGYGNIPPAVAAAGLLSGEGRGIGGADVRLRRSKLLTVSIAPLEGNTALEAGTRKAIARASSVEISAPHAEVTDLLSLFLENVQTEEIQDRCELMISGIIDNYGTIGIAALETRLQGPPLEPLFWKFLTALGARRGEPTDGIAKEILLRQLDSPSAGRRAAAASALGAISGAAVLTALERRATIEQNRMVKATLSAHMRALKRND